MAEAATLGLCSPNADSSQARHQIRCENGTKQTRSGNFEAIRTLAKLLVCFIPFCGFAGTFILSARLSSSFVAMTQFIEDLSHLLRAGIHENRHVAQSDPVGMEYDLAASERCH